MAPIPSSPRRLGAGRPRKSAGRSSTSGSGRAGKSSPTMTNSPSTLKKRRYIPGGPGGGGRYVDEDGTEIPVGGTGPGGYNYVGPRGRIGQENAKKGLQPIVFPRRDKLTRTRTVLPRSRQPAMRFSSAAQAAAAVVQSDGYKPREERGWEEFHTSLDIDAKLTAFSAEEVDGIQKSRPVTPAGPHSANGSTNGVNGAHTPVKAGGTTPGGSANGDSGRNSVLGTPSGTSKRRPGRPPRDPVAFYAAREAAALAASNGSPTTPRHVPMQNQAAKERLTLPQPSYRKVDALAKFEDKASGQVRYVEQSMANVGYQETDIFIRPEHHLIKVSDWNDEDLDLTPGLKNGGEANLAIGIGGVGRVEYDMDEQDDKWLEAYNAQRKAMETEPITREIFEITITKIEKEWHALEKRIPKPNPKPPQTHRPRSSSAAAVNGEPHAGEEQDSKCAICDDGDCENTNAIVFCDGCDLAVHQECYGVPFIPEGQWLCRKCQLIGGGIPTCIFCPNTDGGFKQTNSSKWGHLLCAMWIPEVSLGNHTFMEPIMDVEKVPKNRWKLTCYICHQRMGACIQCGNKLCFQAFHVTCARRSRLFLKMKNSHGTLAELDPNTQLKAFCDKHCPPEYARDNDVQRATREARSFYKKTMRGRLWADSQATALAMAASHQHAIAEHTAEESHNAGTKITLTLGDSKKKGVQPAKNVWKLPSGAPVIPSILFTSVETALQRFTLRKRREWSAAACRYWTLKREARRGAALLKRLQLQMETFSSMELTRRNFAGMGHSGRGRLARRIEFAEKLVKDLTMVQEQAAGVVDRETEKLKEAELEVNVVDTIYFPIAKLLPPILEKAIARDTKKLFIGGLLELHSKLIERYYVLATTFAQSLSNVFKAGIESGCVSNSESNQVDEIVHTSPSKQVVNDLKERRKLAKRIIKAIQPQLEFAVRAEADITNGPAEKMVHDLELLLEGCLYASPGSVSGSVGADIADHDPDAMVVDVGEVQQTSSTAVAGIPENNGESELMEIELHDEDAPGEDDDEVVFQTASVPNDEPVDSEMTNGNIELAAESSINVIKSSDTPPDTNGYVHPAPHEHPAPLTPPISTGGANSLNGQDHAAPDAASFLTHGGVPWYLTEFDPIGTTLLDPPLPSKDNAREMSEELSEIDDDELRRMSVDMAENTITEVITEKATIAGKAKKAKAKKRSKRYY